MVTWRNHQNYTRANIRVHYLALKCIISKQSPMSPTACVRCVLCFCFYIVVCCGTTTVLCLVCLLSLSSLSIYPHPSFHCSPPAGTTNGLSLQSVTPCATSDISGTRAPTRWGCRTRCHCPSSRCSVTGSERWRSALQQVPRLEDGRGSPSPEQAPLRTQKPSAWVWFSFEASCM